MKLTSLSGRSVSKNIYKYRIDWEAKSASKFQKKVKDELYYFWEDHVVFEEFPCFGSRLTLDFLNITRMIAIEVQGAAHVKYIPFFHGNNRFNYLKQICHDEKKQEFCLINGIELIEIFPEDLKVNFRRFLKKQLDG